MNIILIVVAVIVVLILVFGQNSSSHGTIPDNGSDKDILDLAQQGKKIQAIKLYRALHGVGLKEAKEAVDKMLK